MENKAPQVAVIGGGYWGKNLIRNFSELGALALICDNDPLKKEAYSKGYPDAFFSTDYGTVLENDQIKGVVIATPALEHYQMAKAALEKGKDVLVEKPLALTVKQGGELVDLAEDKKRVLMVGHVLEYHPAVEKLKSLVKEGALGKIRYIYSNRLNLGKFRTEENILWSFAPHDISVIINLLGMMPGALDSSGGSYLNSEIADVTMSNMFFKSGVRAHIFVSWLHPFKEQKLVVVGSEKMAVFNDVADDKLLLYSHKVSWVNQCPVANKGEAVKVEVAGTEPLKGECAHFLECIKKRAVPRTGPENALNVLKVLSAMQKSLEASGEKIYLEGAEKGLATGGAEKRFEDVFIHPSSIVESGVRLGRGTKIWHFSHVSPGADLGEKCNLGQNVFIGKNVKIGTNVKIQNNVSVFEGVTLEDDVFCGPSMVFTNVNRPRSKYPKKSGAGYDKTRVKRGATIGANAVIRCGTTIGEHAFIGAGAVVTGDVPDYSLMVGVPARQAGWVCECGQRLDEDFKCGECGRLYTCSEGIFKEKNKQK